VVALSKTNSKDRTVSSAKPKDHPDDSHQRRTGQRNRRSKRLPSESVSRVGGNPPRTIKAKLTSGEDVLISGFGKFCVKEKRQRRGRNPASGEAMMLDARRVVTFKCSGQLRDKINESR